MWSPFWKVCDLLFWPISILHGSSEITCEHFLIQDYFRIINGLEVRIAVCRGNISSQVHVPVQQASLKLMHWHTSTPMYYPFFTSTFHHPPQKEWLWACHSLPSGNFLLSIVCLHIRDYNCLSPNILCFTCTYHFYVLLHSCSSTECAVMDCLLKACKHINRTVYRLYGKFIEWHWNQSMYKCYLHPAIFPVQNVDCLLQRIQFLNSTLLTQ